MKVYITIQDCKRLNISTNTSYCCYYEGEIPDKYIIKYEEILQNLEDIQELIELYINKDILITRENPNHPDFYKITNTKYISKKERKTPKQLKNILKLKEELDKI